MCFEQAWGHVHSHGLALRGNFRAYISFIYGLRKPCFNVKGSIRQYEDAIHRTKTAEQSVERMETIFEILKKLEA